MKGKEKDFRHEMTGSVNFMVPIGKKEFDVLKAFSDGFWDIAAVKVLENQKLMISLEYTNALAIYKGEKAVLDSDGDGGDAEAG